MKFEAPLSRRFVISSLAWRARILLYLLPVADVVQLVEHRVVIPGVAGSSPVVRPTNAKALT